MTIVKKDARGRLGAKAKQACCKRDLGDVLFADDTLLISITAGHLQEYMQAITFCGGQYGVQADRQDKSAVGWDHQEKVEHHESQKDYKRGFGGKFGVQQGWSIELKKLWVQLF